jgi:predicted O-methyltransferase YrrM
LIRPEVIIETGVGAGFSTAHLLEAIRINECGILYSIDYYKENEQGGWVFQII